MRQPAQHGRIVADELAQAFARRYRAEPGRGYGRGAHDLLAAIADGTPWRQASSAAFDGRGSLGNGAAMRAAPIGGYFAGEPARAASEARASAEPTHAHVDGIAGAMAVAVAASVVAAGGDAQALFATVLALTPASDTRAVIARAATLPLEADVATAVSALGNGSDVRASDTVPFALWCAARHRDDFAAALWTTVSALGDRDTTCAIAGGIVALAAPIPPAWLAAREPLPPVVGTSA